MAVIEIGFMKQGRKFTREDGYSEQDLIQYGIDHLRSAKILLKKQACCHDSAAYLCHLCLELLLKAFVLNLKDYFEDSHCLLGMYEELKKSGRVSLDSDFEKWLSDLDAFFNCRYPCPKKPIYFSGDDLENIIVPIAMALIEKLPEELRLHADKIFKNPEYPQKGNRTLIITPKNG